MSEKDKYFMENLQHIVKIVFQEKQEEQRY
jgi:hypothetical protein